MSRFAGGVVVLHFGAQHGPVVRHYSCKEQRDAHQDHEERQPDLQGFALIHPAPDRCSQRVIHEVSPNPGSFERWEVSAGRAGWPPAAAGLCQLRRQEAINAHRESSAGGARLSAPSHRDWFGFPRAGGAGARSQSLPAAAQRP